MTAHVDRPAFDVPLHVLLVGANPKDARRFEEHLWAGGQEATLHWEEDFKTGLQVLREKSPDVLALDLGLPDSEGTETVRRCVEAAPALPVVVLTEAETLGTVRPALQSGATEYLQKDELSPRLVQRTLRWALERKGMGRELRKREAQLRSITERVSEGIFRSTPDEGLVYANQAFAEMFGYESVEAVLQVDPATLCVNPTDQGGLIWPVEMEGDAGGVEIKFRRRDGSTFPGRLRGSVTRDDPRGTVHYDGVITDISEHSKRERERAEREARYRAIAESAQDAIVTMDADSTIQFANPAVEDIFGYAPDELVGESMTNLMPERHRERHQHALDRFLETGEKTMDWSAVEFPGLRKDGTEIDLSISFATYEHQGETYFEGVIREVTERKQREREVRVLSAAMEQAQEAVLITEAEPLSEPGPRIVYVNSAFEAMTGYAEEEVLGETPRLLQGPETSREVLDSLREALEAGEPWQGETTNYRKDGTPFLLQWSIAPVRNEDGHIEHWVSVQRDVTDRRETEEALREERDLLDRILETSPVAITVFNPEGEFVQASGRAEDVLGLEREEITGRAYNDPDWEITAPNGSPMPDEELPFARVMSTGQPVHDVEHAIEWPSGRRRLLSVSGAPLHGPEGETKGAVFHIDDITEQREIEQRFRGVFENAGLGIALMDESGAVLEANPALESMLGYEAGELQHLHFEYVTHPEYLDADKQLYQELVAGERDQYQLEKRYLRQGGDAFWGHLTVSRRDVPDGVQVVGMVENIDDRKRQEQQLRAAKEEAERMNRLKSAFLANMSHEIRTPLTSILGFAEIIGEQVADDAEGTIPQCARRIEDSGRRLLSTLNRVLNLSKLEAGEMSFSAGALDLAAEVKDAVRQFEPQAEEAGIDLRVEIGEGPTWCRADKDGLRVVHRNLLSNAVKYTEGGGRVWVRTRTEDETVVLEVEDTGIGMDPAKTAELFEAFTQESEGIGREYEGTGLGLTVAHRVVEEMGGSIEVETRKGEGSCFTVRLPKAERDV